MNALKFVPGFLILILPLMLFSQVSVHISPNCEVIANEVNISVSGDWINNGTFTSNGSNLNFTGDSDQILTPPPDKTMQNLIVNKTNGELFLSDTLYIVDSLNLNTGNLVTHDTSLVILLQEAEVHGGDTSSFVDGPMAKVYAVSASPDTFVFPTGDSLDYRPVSVQFASITGDTIIVKVEQVNASAHDISTTYSQLSDVSTVRYWNIEKSGPGGFTDARVTLTYDTVATNDSAFIASDLRMAQLNNSATWVNIGGTGTADSTGSIQGDAFNDFLGSMFTLGEAALVLADITSFMEGPYSSGSMNTYLQQNEQLPLTQPYSGSPWNYGGTETVGSVPENVVDWILVELRTGTDAATMVSQRACFVLNDGSIVDTDGISPLRFEDVIDGSYYVVIYHRNHLAIMTAAAISLSSSEATVYDFTSDLNSAYTTGPAPMSEVATGVYAMVSGDGNSDNGVDAIDQNTIWIPTNGTPWDYSKKGDYNLDGGIDAIDYNLFWITNNGRGSQVPLSGGVIITKAKKKDIDDIIKTAQTRSAKKEVRKTSKKLTDKTKYKEKETLKLQKKNNNIINNNLDE
jgi:hypothetical protein